MRTINADHVSAVIRLINQSPFFRLLAMRIRELGMGYSILDVEVRQKHLNPFGSVHGGLYSSLIDTAAYWAVYCEMQEGKGYVTIDVGMHLLAPANQGPLVVTGTRIKTGRSLCLAEAKIETQDGKLLATGTSKMMVVKEKQTIAQLAQSKGIAHFPRKFVRTAAA
jgi:uncharacterized protein (TIGR00369 family)